MFKTHGKNYVFIVNIICIEIYSCYLIKVNYAKGGNHRMSTHTEIHRMASRAMPYDVCLYRHAVMAYKLLKNTLCEDELVQLNFQLVDNERLTKIKFIKRQNYDVGKNILLNRLHSLNNKIV